MMGLWSTPEEDEAWVEREDPQRSRMRSFFGSAWVFEIERIRPGLGERWRDKAWVFEIERDKA